LPGVTGPVAAAGAVLFFAELLVAVLPMSDFLVIAIVTLPEASDFFDFRSTSLPIAFRVPKDNKSQDSRKALISKALRGTNSLRQYPGYIQIGEKINHDG
jgi:hypothetical protein